MVVAQSVPLVWRRRDPLVVAAVVLTAFVAGQTLGVRPTPSDVGALVALYSAAAYGDAVPVWVPWVAATALWWGLFALLPGIDLGDLATVAGLWVLLVVVPLVLGTRLRQRRSGMLQEHVARARAERERDEAASRVAAEERARIVGELHDLVARRVGAIVAEAERAAAVAAEAATPVPATSPAAAPAAALPAATAAPAAPARATAPSVGPAEVLRGIARDGRQALTDLRHLVGAPAVLAAAHPGGEAGLAVAPVAPPPGAPAPPGLAALDDLIARLAAEGLEVVLAVEGTPDPAAGGRRLRLPHRGGGAGQRGPPRPGRPRPGHGALRARRGRAGGRRRGPRVAHRLALRRGGRPRRHQHARARRAVRRRVLRRGPPGRRLPGPRLLRTA